MRSVSGATPGAVGLAAARRRMSDPPESGLCTPDEGGGGVAELREVDGLAHVRVEADRPVRRKVLVESGERDARRLSPLSFRAGTQPDGEVEARAVRQLEIADDELRLEPIDAALRFDDAVHGEHAGTDQPERGHQQLARVRVILDDEDAAAEQALDRLRLRLGPHARSARRRLTAS